MSRGTLIVLMAITCAAAAPPAAQAQPSSTQRSSAQPSSAHIAGAKTLFRAGASAYKAGNFAAAVQAFDQAYALDPKPAIRFSAAQALRRWYAVSEDPDHLVEALAYYRDYLDAVKSGGRVLDASRAKNEIEILLAQLGVGPGEEPGEEAVKTARLRRGTLMIDGPEVQGARVSIDDKPMEGWPVFAELPPGRYTVRVEAPGYQPFERAAQTVAGQLTPVEAALDELPARVNIRSQDGAEVIVDGRPMGRLPLRDSLELPSGTHRVVVGSPGHTVFSEDVTLSRGQERAIDADLAMTGQRVASWTFFAVSGLGAGAGVTLVALAVGARADARALLEASEAQQRELTVTEAQSYNDALTRRDDFTRAAGATLSLSALSAGVGLLLYLLDDPDLYEAAAADESAARRPLQPRPFQLGVTPPPSLLGRHPPGGVLTVRGQF